MKQVNAIQIETVWGYKTFELYQGDITNLDFSVDILAVSVLMGDYYPLKGTVVGALYENHQIRLESLLEDCEFDLRKYFSCWVSKEIENPKFKRLLCVEMLSLSFTTGEVIKNVFIILSILEAKGIVIQSVALPLLGTGSLSINPDKVIKALLNNSLEHLQRSQTLKEIKFVTYHQDRVEQLNEAMNQALSRVKIVLPKGDFVEKIRKDIKNKLEKANSITNHSNIELFSDVRRIVSSEESRSFELGIAARKIVEFIVEDILGNQKGMLYQKIQNIQSVSEPKIADWIIYYMHILRVLGNESAHEIGNKDRVPVTLSEADLELCLLSIYRLLDFWIDFKSQLR